jgi:hypothetical protein
MRQVFAQVTISDYFSPASKFPTFGALVGILIRNAFVLAGLICFFFLVIGGVGFIMGAGAGEGKQAAKGKQTITGAVIGLIVIIASVWIIKILARMTGIDILNQIIP